MNQKDESKKEKEERIVGFDTTCNRTSILLRNQQRKGRKIRRIEEKDRNFIERNGLFEKATLLPWHSRCQEPPEFSRNELQTEYLPSTSFPRFCTSTSKETTNITTKTTNCLQPPLSCQPSTASPRVMIYLSS
jgi:hypothetical protein